jgi:hypothetical protein
MNNEILLRGIVTEAPAEGIAQEAIVPGMLVELNPSTGQIRKHPTAAGVVNGVWFALAASWYQPTNVLGTPAIDYPWAAGDTMVLHHTHPGDRVNALLEPSHAAVPAGTVLESAGGGYLQAGTTNRIGVCAEDCPGSATAAVRIKVDVIL